MPSTGTSAQSYIECLLLCVFGAISSLTTKFQYKTKADGLPDINGTTLRSYEFPWFQVLIMFIGEFYCLPAFYLLQLYKKYHKDSLESDRNVRKNDEEKSIRKPFLVKYCRFLVAGSAMCDLISTGMSLVGLLYLEASISSMLNGCSIIFVGLLSWLCLRAKMNKHKWIGIGSATSGVLTMSVGALIESHINKSTNSGAISTGKVCLGFILILGGLIVSAVQMVFDEKVLNDTEITPLENVGLQGLYGIILTSLILLMAYYIPGNAVPRNNYENVLDALLMLYNNRLLLISSIVYTFVISAINILGMRIVRNLSATFRSVVNNMRGLIIWAVEILMFYGLQNTQYGSSLTLYSLFKVAGFALLITGTVTYRMGQEIKKK